LIPKCNRNSRHKFVQNCWPKELGGLLCTYLHPLSEADEISGVTFFDVMARCILWMSTLVQVAALDFSPRSNEFACDAWKVSPSTDNES
jgi:hypothetical protein